MNEDRNFMVFRSKHRAAVVAENPAIAFTEVGKELGRRWGLLSQEEKDAFKPDPAAIDSIEFNNMQVSASHAAMAQNPARADDGVVLDSFPRIILSRAEMQDITIPPTPNPILNFDYVVARGRRLLTLPINKIDGVKCYVQLSHDKHWPNMPVPPMPRASLTLIEEDKVDYVNMEITAYNADNYVSPKCAHNQAEFEEMIATLKNYKFDKVQNQFVDIRKEALTPIDFYDCLKSPSISFEDECCVCLEVTSGTIRNCKHPICMRCASNLIKRNCPICRERICCESDGSWDEDDEE